MELRIEHLSKRYATGVQALDDVSLRIGPGMLGLLGPNGAGKSTLMRIIATLQEPDSGAVFLDDIDVLRQKDKVREVLGYLPQEFGLYPKVTAHALLDHFAYLRGWTKAGLLFGLLKLDAVLLFLWYIAAFVRESWEIGWPVNFGIVVTGVLFFGFSLWILLAAVFDEWRAQPRTLPRKNGWLYFLLVLAPIVAVGLIRLLYPGHHHFASPLLECTETQIERFVTYIR